MELKNIILHQIIREDNKKPELNLSSQLLAIGDTTNDFIEKLVKSYTSKSPTYGTFNKDITNNPFQTSVENYFKDKDFLKFSKQAMNTLKKAIEKPQAKGGYVVFTHYVERSKDFIGCTDFTSAKENSKNLQSAVTRYMNEKNFDDDKKRKTRRELKKYTDEQISNNKDIIIVTIMDTVKKEILI